MATKRIALLAASALMLTSFGAQPSAEESIFTQGEFFIGCNYWAKNAGMYMWSQWRPDVVEKEIGELATIATAQSSPCSGWRWTKWTLQ